jgi:hypothetical protein
MAKKPTITTVTSGFSSQNVLASNFENLRDGFDNTLSLDGSTPNAMGADLDLNNNDIINVSTLEADTIIINGDTLVPNLQGPAAVVTEGDVTAHQAALSITESQISDLQSYLTAHPNITAATSVNNTGRTYIQDITLDSNGHITGITSATETVVNTDTTYVSSDFDHDSLSGFVANEHIDWTTDQGATNIHANNYTNTTYSVGDNGLTQKNFTTTLKTKLDGIEAGATTDQTKADIDALGIAASTANTLATTRNISLTGDVSGSTNFDGSGNVSITAVVADDSHNHVISNVDGLQTELDGKLSTSGKAADSNLLDGVQGSSYLRSDTSDTANSNISFASGAGLSGGLDSNLSGFFLPQNPVGKHLKSPYFFNDVAYARLRGATVSVDVDGTPMTTTSKIDAMLNAGSDFWNMSAAGVTTVTITITNLPRNLNYGTYMGLTFGNELWRANSITLEYSTDNGSTWTTARSTTSNSEEYFLGNFNGGSTATNALRWTLEDFNRNSMRIVSLFAYNFSSKGMGGLYVTRDGGDIYGNVTVDGTVSSSGFQFPDGTTQTTATASTSSTSQTSIATYSATTYGSAKLIVTVDRGSDRQVSELLIVHNGTTAFATEYGVTATGSTLANFDVDISGGNIRLLATATSATTTGYTVTEILVGA